MNNNKYRIKLEDSVYTGMVDSPKIDRININGKGLSIKKQWDLKNLTNKSLYDIVWIKFLSIKSQFLR